MTARYRFRPRVLPLPPGAPPDVPGWLASLAGRPGLAALDSPGRHALILFDPLPVAPPEDLPGLRDRAARLVREPGDPVPGPFHGGFAGAFAYDLGVASERPVRVAPEPWSTPRVVGGLYVDFVVLDLAAGSGRLVLGDEPGDGRPPVEERLRSLERDLARAPELEPVRALGALVRHTPRTEHVRRIEACRAAIARGDLYQANLAHRFTRRVAGHPVEIYRSLRAVNPAPHMGFLAWDGGALCSASPELLVEVEGGRARTRPIKGTAPRAADAVEDDRLARALLASEKDRAELAMIVDLERNDLGRVAAAGSVRVEGFPTLESYARVHHLVADVACDLAPGRDAVDALVALFPGGSITGAPKLASMDLIAALEGEGRGFFTGSMGFLDTRGHARFNILIRTLVWRPGEVSYHVGGGITWGSEPEAEDDETLAKGAALAAALEVGSAPVRVGLGASRALSS